MKFMFVSTMTFEPWYWVNPENPGIGGSETSHVEMARRLSEHGHTVVSVAPVPWREAREAPGGAVWLNVDDDGIAKAMAHMRGGPDIVVVYRAPAIIDHLPEGVNAWLICQDVDYRSPGNELTPERARKFSRIVALCETHGQYLRAAHPEVKDRVCVSSNGIKVETIEQIAQNPPSRNPFKLIYASSPDRGLETLLHIFRRAHEAIPDLEISLHYGFSNMDRVIEHFGPKHQAAQIKDRIFKLMDQPGVTWHGRTGQTELLKAWFSSGIWCHPSNFTETSCITCMEAQACGAIPITQPVWAIAENVRFGTFIDGNVDTQLVRARYVREILRIASQPELQAEIRGEMMNYAQMRFSWEQFVTQWEEWAGDDATRRSLEMELREEVVA